MANEPWLARAAAAFPQRSAVEDPERSLTYAELLKLALRVAGRLRGEGVAAGSWVGIEAVGGVPFALAFHGILLAGCVAVPIDPRWSAAERALVEERLAAVLPLDDPADGEALARPVTYRLDDPAVVIHTSGTTGTPRPVVLTYRNLLFNALGSAVALGLDRNERWLCVLPLSHVGGLTILTRSAVYATTAIVHPRFDVDLAYNALERQGATLVSLVAVTLQRLLDAGWERPRSLRAALTGGGPVPAPLLERARGAGVPVSLTYGLTQAASQVATEPIGRLGEGLQPLFCTQVAISPAGEILVRGQTVAPGEVGADGWLHTGDKGALGPDGSLIVEGRLAETIISGGENVSPAEVEEVLIAHPSVREAGVFGRPDSRWGEAVWAVVVPAEGATVEPEELRAHCRRRLAPFKVPKGIEVVSTPLPRTASGKLLRRRLAELVGDGGATG